MWDSVYICYQIPFWNFPGNPIFLLHIIILNKTDLQALTLVGLTGQEQVLDPLAVLHLDNWLCIICRPVIICICPSATFILTMINNLYPKSVSFPLDFNLNHEFK